MDLDAGLHAVRSELTRRHKESEVLHKQLDEHLNGLVETKLQMRANGEARRELDAALAALRDEAQRRHRSANGCNETTDAEANGSTPSARSVQR